MSQVSRVVFSGVSILPYEGRNLLIKKFDKDKYKEKDNDNDKDKDILRTPPKSNPRDL